MSEETDEEKILVWIEERLNKIREKQKELHDRDWLYKTEDRKAGELREKERLLEELKEYIGVDNGRLKMNETFEMGDQVIETIGELAEKTEETIIDFLLEDEMFQDFIKENYILLEMDNLESNLEGTDKIELQRVVYPMRREEFEKLKEENGLNTAHELMKKKLEKYDSE